MLSLHAVITEQCNKKNVQMCKKRKELFHTPEGPFFPTGQHLEKFQKKIEILFYLLSKDKNQR